MTIVKICGIRDAGTALAALEAGADLLGMVFAPSRRQVSPSEAEEIARAVPDTRRLVGVFVNAPAEDVMSAVDRFGLGYAQLSGDESEYYCRALGVRVVKAIRGAGAAPDCAIAGYARASALLLVDSSIQGAYGGTGALADWDFATSIAYHHPVLLAGGLTPANVADAIRTVRPAGVDVSSGVEVDGRKSPELIRQFVETVRGRTL